MEEARRTGRRGAPAAVAAGAMLAAAVCVTGGTAGAAAEPRPVTAPEAQVHGDGGGDGKPWLRAGGRFAPPRAVIAPKALTYRQDLVPAASRISVMQLVTERGTEVGVKVTGVKADHTFGVHVHTEPCGAEPDASGPHYQNRRDPVQPSTDPAYANPRNEVWLDLGTDESGSGGAFARQRWNFREGGARSVVLHEHTTRTGHGQAGQAGDRVACFSVPFKGSAWGVSAK